MQRTMNYLFIKLLLATLFFLPCAMAWAQYENVTIMSRKANGVGPCQPSIYINPKSPNQMVASMEIGRAHV